MMDRVEPFVIHETECELERHNSSSLGAGCWRTLISGDRTPTASLTVGIAESDPDESRVFLPHKHQQPEIYYVLSGEGIVTISGREYPLRSGTTVFIPGSVEHDVLSTGVQPLRLLYVFPADSFAEIKYEFPGS